MPADAARLTIDLDAIAANYRLLRDMAGGAETAPVVKADGYGMGAGQTALRLWAEGARTFYVARLAEGEALRRALGDRAASILVFDGCPDGAAGRLRAAGLIPVLNSGEQIAAWADAGPCALHVDTGMNRLGLTLAEAAEVAATGGLRIDLLLSHLACASQPGHPLNDRQQQRFTAVRRLFPKARASLASSGGVFLGADYHFDQVRPGVSLYGGGPHDGHEPRLATVATLEAPILQIRDVPEGDSVGYGADFVAGEPLKVAIVSAGYADGYLRASAPDGGAWFAGRRRRLLGRVSMDLIAIDITGAQAKAGDMVELVGPNLLLDEAAKAAGASAYEFLVRMGRRSRRRWVGEA
ncbi:alanine racemase [Caulobacter sp. NIBR1757]|uniref:alanine racemase n=1 Tax=Caulobacter sp. NIBR1757 TaxID=3016000 RepID=UPI0022F11986|nr:alanine racemase [Caulobacter sp. NIBR1757]WGM38681.1 Alanine racemase, biosynthetic [Caulobacter sp. NIBR1757]